MTPALLSLLFVVFLGSGAAKLLMLPFEVAAFERWGYPLWFMLLIGVLEVAGALGLCLPRLRRWAAPALSALMLGAIATHLTHREWPMVGVSSLIFLATANLAWRLWRSNG
jgi:uncharacterized membrane protein YphA (DoxX/SURF4 family)